MKTFNKVWKILALILTVFLVIAAIIDKDTGEAIAWSCLAVTELGIIIDTFKSELKKEVE